MNQKAIYASYIMGALSSLIDNDHCKTLDRLGKMIDESNFDNKAILKLCFGVAITLINEKNAGASIDQSTIEKTLKDIIHSLECYTKKE